MDYIAVIGLIAGTCTTLSLLPQLVKTWRSKETKDISLLMYVVLVSGMALWVVYGMMIGSAPVVLANLVSFVFAVVVLGLKIKYG